MDCEMREQKCSLEGLIKLIRFPLMTAEQFADCMKAEYNLLSSNIFMEIASGDKNEFEFTSILLKLLLLIVHHL